MKMRNDLIQVGLDLKQYQGQGFKEDVEAAVRHAQCATRAFVERLHPDTGFGGKSLKFYVLPNGKIDNLIKKGTFKVYGYRADANIYADFYARFWNTGVYFKPLRFGPHKGESPGKRTKPPRDKVIVKNTASIEEFFANEVRKYLAERMKKKI